MKFSILMPTFNRPKFIKAAVKAIQAQDYENWELIIKDGGKPIFDLLPKDDRIIYIHSKDRGITHAMNIAMSVASGDVMNWSNDDDTMAEGTLKFVAENLGDAKWAYGRILMGNHLWGDTWDYERLCMQGNFVPQPSVFWTREAFQKIGLMDESEDLTSDYEYWLRLGKNFPHPKFFDRVMANYTVHPDQITQKIQGEQLRQAAATRAKYQNL